MFHRPAFGPSIVASCALLLATCVVPIRPGAPQAAGGDDSLTVIAWNVESGDADPRAIAARLGEFQGVDLWGLSEVNGAEDARLFEAGAEVGEAADFTRILGGSGGGDRLLLLYDEGRFDLVRQGELEAINVRGNVRAPLYAHLRDAQTGVEFIFMVNHLYRSDDAARHWQAAALNDWAETQSLPIVAVGDYNFDWSVDGGERDHDPGYDNLTADGIWEWVRPPVLVSTQDSDYDDVLDFVFTANAAQEWQAQAEIVVTSGDFPDDDATSDHRPVLATFVLDAGEESA
jgi:endonuclease/exonuclease/phosphatase family metal-dependent hydrolase